MHNPRLSKDTQTKANPYSTLWNRVIADLRQDSVVTKLELTKKMCSMFAENERLPVEKAMDALIRLSVSRGDLHKLGVSYYVRTGLSKESAVALSQIAGLAGILVEEHSPGTILGYEDLFLEATGDTERHYVLFCKALGDYFRWFICNQPLKVKLNSLGQPVWDERASKLLASRLELIMTM